MKELQQRYLKRKKNHKKKYNMENLDYGYTEIQNTYSGSASDLMFFPTGSTQWVLNWFEMKKNNGTNG